MDNIILNDDSNNKYALKTHTHSQLHNKDVFIQEDGKIAGVKIGGADPVIPFKGGGKYKLSVKVRTYVNNNDHPKDMSKYIDAKYDIIINTKDMSVTVDHTNPSAGVHRSDGGGNCTYNVWSGKATVSITKID